MASNLSAFTKSRNAWKRVCVDQARLHEARLHQARLHQARLHQARLHKARLHKARLHAHSVVPTRLSVLEAHCMASVLSTFTKRHVHTHTHTLKYTHTLTHNTHARTHTHTHAHTHAHTHTNTHTHTDVPTRLNALKAGFMADSSYITHPKDLQTSKVSRLIYILEALYRIC